MDFQTALALLDQLRAVDWLAILGAAYAVVSAVMTFLRIVVAMMLPFVRFTETRADDRFREHVVLRLDAAQLFIDRFAGRLSVIKPRVTGGEQSK